MLFLKAAASFLLGAAGSAAAAAPVIPQTWTAEITTNTSGTARQVPQGVKTYKQFYDYTNKRLRKDASDGMTKVYRYDKNIMPPLQPGPNDPDFASPKGYQFQLSNPDLNCCWLWLIDTADGKPYTADRMLRRKSRTAPRTWARRPSSAAASTGRASRRSPSCRRGTGT